MATYYFDCPDCGTSVELRKRVTVSKRTCSHCGYKITPEGIDQTTISRNAALAEADRESTRLLGWLVGVGRSRSVVTGLSRTLFQCQ